MAMAILIGLVCGVLLGCILIIAVYPRMMRDM